MQDYKYGNSMHLDKSWMNEKRKEFALAIILLHFFTYIVHAVSKTLPVCGTLSRKQLET